MEIFADLPVLTPDSGSDASPSSSPRAAGLARVMRGLRLPRRRRSDDGAAGGGSGSGAAGGKAPVHFSALFPVDSFSSKASSPPRPPPRPSAATSALAAAFAPMLTRGSSRSQRHKSVSSFGEERRLSSGSSSGSSSSSSSFRESSSCFRESSISLAGFHTPLPVDTSNDQRTGPVKVATTSGKVDARYYAPLPVPYLEDALVAGHIDLNTPTSTVDVCGFCDLPLNLPFASERKVRTRCTHAVHFECLYEMTRYHGGEQPLCGICEATCIPLDGGVMEEIRKRTLVSQNQYADFLAEHAPDGTISTLGGDSGFDTSGPAEALSDAEGTAGVNFALSSLAQVTFESHNTATNSFADMRLSLASNVLPITSHQGPKSAHALRVLGTHRVRNIEHSSPGIDGTVTTFDCVIGVEAPVTAFYKSGYRLGAADTRVALDEKARVEKLSFQGVRLSEMALGALRLRDSLRVSVDLGAWTSTCCLLFANFLVILREPDVGTLPGLDTVKATVDLRAHLRKITFLEVKQSRVLRLELTAKSLPALYFSGSDHLLRKWSAALHNSDLAFPLAEECKLAAPDIFPPRSAVERTPLDLIVCLPAAKPDSYEFRTFLETLAVVRAQLPPFYQLGLVVYGVRDTQYVKLMRVGAPDWGRQIERAFQKAAAGMSTMDTSAKFSLDGVLKEVQRVAEEHNTERASASVLLVCNHERLSSVHIPAAFTQAGIPIHTIGLGENHDSFSLAPMSSKTGGVYTYAEDLSEVTGIFERYIAHEKNYTHKAVVINLRAGTGATIEQVSGANTYTSDESAGCSLGNLAEGDLRTIVVRIRIDHDEIDRNAANNVLLDVSVLSKCMTSTAYESAQIRTELAITDKDLVKLELKSCLETFRARSAPVTLQRVISATAADILDTLLHMVEEWRLADAARYRVEAISELNTLFSDAEKVKWDGHYDPAMWFQRRLRTVVMDIIENFDPATATTAPENRVTLIKLSLAAWVLRNEVAFSQGSSLERMYLKSPRRLRRRSFST